MLRGLAVLAVSLGFLLGCSGADSDDAGFDADDRDAAYDAGQGSSGYGGEGAWPGDGGTAGEWGAAGEAGAAGSPTSDPGDPGAPGGTGAGGSGGSEAPSGGSGGGASGGGSGGTPPPSPDPKLTAEMVYSTVNIGRNYATKAEVKGVIDKVGDVIGAKAGPKFIGWQEIAEADPCGSTCEIDSIHARFTSANGWTTHRPEQVKVPITSKGSSDFVARAEFASPGWAGVSPTRFVTVVRYKDRGLAVLNTHFIAGAWSCNSNVAQRKEYWHQAWNVLKTEVKKESDLGRNVIVTGDLNRPRAPNSCNPAWEPTSLHARAQIIGGENIDYIFAVPAAGNEFVISTQNGTKLRGSITLGIDGHEGHWVIGRFQKK